MPRRDARMPNGQHNPGVDEQDSAGLSGPLGMPEALLVLAVLPVLGLLVLAPTLRQTHA